MTTPIPSEIMAKAREEATEIVIALPSIVNGERAVLHSILTEAIARALHEAVLAERAACADTAAKHFDLRHADKARFASAAIARAIRARA